MTSRSLLACYRLSMLQPSKFDALFSALHPIPKVLEVDDFSKLWASEPSLVWWKFFVTVEGHKFTLPTFIWGPPTNANHRTSLFVLVTGWLLGSFDGVFWENITFGRLVMFFKYKKQNFPSLLMTDYCNNISTALSLIKPKTPSTNSSTSSTYFVQLHIYCTCQFLLTNTVTNFPQYTDQKLTKNVFYFPKIPWNGEMTCIICNPHPHFYFWYQTCWTGNGLIINKLQVLPWEDFIPNS